MHPTPFRMLCGLFALSATTALHSEEALQLPKNLRPYQPATDTVCYVGTYTTSGKSKGIYFFRLETQNAEVAQNILLVPLGLAAESVNPSFLAADFSRRLVFAANETDTFNGAKTGAVSAFRIDPGTGRLALINQVSSGGAGPCHLALDRTGKFLVVSNYNDGTIAVVPVAADGQLRAPSQVIQHRGRSVNPQRQAGPHAHCATFDPANNFVFACDLGLDQVLAYHFEAATGILTPAATPFVATKPGAGPRHLAFRPDGKFAYVVNELDSTVSAYAYDAAAGKLTPLQTESSLPPYFDGKNSGAEIAVHPSGKWLYVSNRGNETVVLFDIDPEKGTISYTEEQNTGGKKPRHFGLQPSAKHLAIANQDSDTLLVCRIDEGNGRLKPSGVFAPAPSPVCVLFFPPPAAR